MGLAEDAVGAATGGSSLPWVLLGGVVAILAAAATGYFYGHHVEELEFAAYRSAQTAAAAKQVADNKSALLKQQQADQAAMAKINQTHGEALNEITKRRDALLAANRSLSQRLYVHVASAGSAESAVSAPGTGGSVDAQAGVAALDQRSAEFFIDEFSAADRLAADYAALQQVIVNDRATCNGQLPGITQTEDGVK